MDPITGVTRSQQATSDRWETLQLEYIQTSRYGRHSSNGTSHVFSVPKFLQDSDSAEQDVEVDLSCAELHRMSNKYPMYAEREMMPASGEYQYRDSVTLYRLAAMKDNTMHMNLPNKFFKSMADWTPSVSNDSDRADELLYRIRESLKEAETLEVLPAPTAHEFTMLFLELSLIHI